MLFLFENMFEFIFYDKIFMDYKTIVLNDDG